MSMSLADKTSFSYLNRAYDRRWIETIPISPHQRMVRTQLSMDVALVTRDFSQYIMRYTIDAEKNGR